MNEVLAMAKPTRIFLLVHEKGQEKRLLNQQQWILDHQEKSIEGRKGRIFTYQTRREEEKGRVGLHGKETAYS